MLNVGIQDVYLMEVIRIKQNSMVCRAKARTIGEMAAPIKHEVHFSVI